jgi:PAS domain S-box-containing protein
VGDDELDRLLSMRIHNIESKRLQYYLIISLTLALVACVMGWIIRSLLDARYAELLRTERELRDSAEKFSKAFQANPSGIAITDMETGHIIEVNESFAHLYGYTPKDMLGRTTVEVGVWGDAQNREKLIQPLRACGYLRNLEMPTHTRDGATKTIVINAELIELGGKQCVVSLIRDVTEQKRASQEMEWKTAFLEAQVDSALDAILVVNDERKRIQ